MRRVTRMTIGWRWVLALVAAALLTPLAPTQAGAAGTTLTLVAYSTPREAYEAIIPKFQATAAGKDVEFETSYGASGDQSRAVAGGLPADVVAFSLAPDIDRLVKEGLVDEDWNADPHKGMVTDSVVVLVVRKGNPKHIQGWADLVKEGVQVITANPLTSGGARWNVMAAYGAQIKQGKTEEQATEYLRQLFANVPVQDKSAREALQTFVGGKGDVLLSYENEAIAAQQASQPIDYVIPDQTILIENPVAVTSDSEHKDQAKAFVDYLRTPEAQQIFGEKGYRPLDPEVLAKFADKYPKPATQFTIDDLGGWSTVSTKFFDPDTGIVAKVQQQS